MGKTRQTQKLLKLLNADACCDCPKLSEVEGNILECLDDGLYAAGDGATMRFAVIGEDDTQTQVSRVFTVNDGPGVANAFEIYGDAAKSFQDRLFAFYKAFGGNRDIYIQAANGENYDGYVYADFFAQSDGMPFLDIFLGDSSVGEDIQLYIEPGYMQFILGAGNAVWEIQGINQDDTAPMILALDASNNVKWVDATLFGGAGDLQAVTDLGNTTTNNIISSYLDAIAYGVIRNSTVFGLAFTIEDLDTGWGGIYLGSSLEITSPINSDKANIYIGINPGQARVQGGEFNTFLGYQAGLGHLGGNYKMYIQQGGGPHLLYGEFDNGYLWINQRLKIGETYNGLSPADPADPEARLEVIAGTTTVAPIKLNAGTNLTTPVNGTLEFDGTNLYFTSGGVRKTITMV